MICLIVSVIKYQIVILSGNLTRHSRSFTEPTSLIKLTPGAFFCRQVGPRFRKVAPRLKFLNFYLSPGAPSPTNNLSEKKNYFRRKVSYYDEKKKMPLVDHRIVALPKRPPFAPGTCTWQHLAFLLSIDTSDNRGTMREANECPNARYKVKKLHFYRNYRSQLVKILLRDLVKR